MKDFNHLDDGQKREYFDFIKMSVSDGSYFKDARDWYIFRYVTPICERTILIFVSAIALFLSYIVMSMIVDNLPLVEKVPIIIDAKDNSRYFPVIKELNISDNLRNVDEAVVNHMLKTYLIERESFDFRNSNVEELNNKFNKIRNNSSSSEYRKFQSIMNRANPNSPMRYYGKNVFRYIDSISVNFTRMEINNLFDQAKDFVSNAIPKEARIRYRATLSNGEKYISQNYLTAISFEFGGVDQFLLDEKKSKRLKFIVTKYKTYKIK